MLSGFVSRATAKNALIRRAFLSTASQVHLIVNAVGKDRLGIVKDVSEQVTGIGGNVGESQAAKLGSHFSMMMLVHLPADQKAVLEDKLKKLGGLQATVFETQVEAAEFTPKLAYSGYFELEGADNPGIVHKLTTVMNQHGLSVDKMETSDEIAPHGGTTLFRMKGVASAFEPLSAGFNVDNIKKDLDKLADELNCDIHLTDVTDSSFSSSSYYGNNRKVA